MTDVAGCPTIIAVQFHKDTEENNIIIWKKSGNQSFAQLKSSLKRTRRVLGGLIFILMLAASLAFVQQNVKVSNPDFTVDRATDQSCTTIKATEAKFISTALQPAPREMTAVTKTAMQVRRATPAIEESDGSTSTKASWLGSEATVRVLPKSGPKHCTSNTDVSLHVEKCYT